MPQVDYGLLNSGVKINTPFENLSQVLQVRNQQEGNAALVEQRRAVAEERRQKAEQERQAAAAAAQVRALFSRQDAPPTPQELAGIIGPDAATKIFSGFEALKTATGNNQDATRARIASVLGAITAFPSKDLQAKAYTGARAHLIADGTLKPEDAPESYDPAFVKSALMAALKPKEQIDLAAPKAPIHVGDQLVDPDTMQPVFTAPTKPDALGSEQDFIKRWASERRLDPAKLSGSQIAAAKQARARAEQAPSQAQPKDERIVQIQGPNGAPIWVRESDAVNKPAAQAARAVTGAERQVISFFNRAKEASETVAPLEDAIGKKGLAGQTRLQIAPNWLQSPENQSYRQAQRAFTEARLRKESGAAIPPAEYENDAKTYFAQPGDTPEILKQKRKGRETVLDGLAFAAGKAYDEYYGEPRKGSAGAVEEWTRDASGKLVKVKR